MEFEDMQQIWTARTNQPLYTVNHENLFHHVKRKAKSSVKIANVSELLTIIVNAACGIFIFLRNVNGKENSWLYLASAWMLATSAYGLYHRSRRQAQQPAASTSIADHLEKALHAATEQVRLSRMMRFNIIPVYIFISAGLWTSGKPLILAIGMALFFGCCFYFSGWEHRIYVRKKGELALLRDNING